MTCIIVCAAPLPRLHAASIVQALRACAGRRDVRGWLQVVWLGAGMVFLPVYGEVFERLLRPPTNLSVRDAFSQGGERCLA